LQLIARISFLIYQYIVCEDCSCRQDSKLANIGVTWYFANLCNRIPARTV